jgi:hypothetical protein
MLTAYVGTLARRQPKGQGVLLVYCKLLRYKYSG